MDLQASKDVDDWRRIMAMKVSSEYDSEASVVVNKVTARMLNGMAKLKASFQRDPSGEFRYPLLGLVTKYLSVLYDYEEKNALVTMSANLGRYVQAKYMQDVKAQEGELRIIATTKDSRYKAEIATETPPTSRPRLSFTFPNGEIKLEDEMKNEARALSISGFVGASLGSGVFVADYKEENASLKYKFKDEEMTLCPTISWPSQALAVSFKRQFDEANKLSYMYNFNNEAWSAIFKHKATENFKIKMGYDSDVGVSWASAWVGKEDEGAKSAPKKCKLQVMLQLPQNNLQEAVLLFRIKKRWDL
ncbi:hypothetical protein SELMODRAFT_145368 [Selaginella moellendorffii]|uniref:Outer envelope pore protein 37, chloroplastic n=1 Tax=Selaginella moellendorffii TaxID=88036 RepID=D8RAN9_SELML|nr:outer envelope pore protein 37, chloroplastic [Selaginella moellendorffii]XP_002970565.1 outer envelope pore protein 37, chloroplastic [Selaginella moellendorffii]EFJ28695.1 hypothetical protein SELMODRAFT_171472 [Selaginella moellendorffii]EFJ30657.1 hypothetical protein SELMODRAFT_145368 [Selaginella moellendorffii]|eukprot:XP_002968403.1 outer envelope pore protein 37, chloroplastic [Selaginella moellendorffii]